MTQVRGTALALSADLVDLLVSPEHYVVRTAAMAGFFLEVHLALKG
jgi:hypothetical protein